MTRINYGAAITAIIESLGISKTLASMAVTGSFITYGSGQILNGIMGDYVKPRTMIFCGLVITALCNIAMSALSNVYIMTAVWCINGFAQSMMWPPLTRIMAENLSPEEYNKACAAVSASASVATILIYIIVPLCIILSGWRAVFLLSAALGLLVGFLWLFKINSLVTTKPIGDENKNTSNPAVSPMSFRFLLLHSGLIPIMIIILLQGYLRDGLTTWMPAYINDIYRIGTSNSILSTAVLPIFAILSVYASSYLYKSIKNEIKASAIIWFVGLASSLFLIFVYSSQVVISIALMAIITGCMHGVNFMLISILPARYKESGRVSTVSGILNTFTYVGSAISSYGIAKLSESYGWKFTIITWSIVALCGIILNIICVKKWDHVYITKKSITTEEKNELSH